MNKKTEEDRKRQQKGNAKGHTEGTKRPAIGQGGEKMVWQQW